MALRPAHVLRSAARSPVSVAICTRWPPDSHPIEPLNENRSIVILGFIFWGWGYAEENFPSPRDFKVQTLFSLSLHRHVLGTVIGVRSRISLLLLARGTSLKQSLSHLSVALPGT